MKLKSLALSALTLFCASFSLATEQKPIVIEISPEILESFSSEERKAIETLVQLAQKQLFRFDDFTLPELPPSIFDDPNEPAIIEYDALFQRPSSNELPQLATGKGELTPEQLRDIRAEALFRVKSKTYEGQYHVWKVHSLLQSGTTNISVQFKRNTRNGAYDIFVSLPQRWINKRSAISVASALQSVYRGLQGMADLFVGLSANQPLYRAQEIERLLQAEQRSFALRHPNFDTRVLDPELMSKALPIAEKLESSVSRSSGDDSESQLAFLKAWQGALRNSPELESLSPGLGNRLASHAEALFLFQEVESAHRATASKWLEETKNRLIAEHPIRSRDESWLNKRLAKEARAPSAPSIWPKYDAALLALSNHGLYNEALLFKLAIDFNRFQYDALAEQFASQTIPSRTFTHASPILFEENWKVVRIGGDNGRYVLQKHDRIKTDTSKSFWRLVNLWRRSANWTRQALRFFFKESMVDGPVGTRSLLGKEPFYHQLAVDPETGALVASGNKRGTLRSRIKASYERRRELLEAHRNEPAGFMGKGFDRFTLLLKADLWHGFLAPVVLIGAGQPTLTAANLALSTVLGAGSVAIAPAVALLAHAKNVLLFDGDSPNPESKRFLPLPREIVDATVKPSIQTAGALALSALDLGLGATQVAGASVSAVLKKARDTALFPLIRRLGRVPSQDSLLVRRISGPGLASEYYYQVAPDVVLMAMLARMEATDLSVIQARAQHSVTAPERALSRFESIVAAAYGKEAGQGVSGWKEAREIRNAVRTMQAELSKHFQARFQQYERILQTEPKFGSKIRLTEKDLVTTLVSAERMARTYYADAMLEWTTEEIASFWAARDVSTDNWSAIARQELASVFGDSILTPLEQVDAKFVLDVNATPSISKFARALDYSIMTNEAEPLPEPRPSAAPPQGLPRLTAQRLCSTLLLTKSPR